MRNLLLSLVVFLPLTSFAKTVRYELNIENKPVNLSGRKTVDWALTVNGTIPAPTLEFTEGDDAEILVKNGLKSEEVSVHWHGILLPPEEDGVAYLNTPPIFPGQSRLFKFRIRQHGTYWYHSHTMLQEQKGVYGAFVIHPKKETVKADKEVVAVISDWADENPDHILGNLRKHGDYYLYKKDSVRSIFGAIGAGGLGTYLSGQWDRMGGMDLSDVGYDAFLINGKRDSQLLSAKAGEKIRLRLINAGASSYFYVSLGNLPMRVIAADGVNIQPIVATEILMGMAETYDVLLTLPEQKNFELRATAQDVTGRASAWIGGGEKMAAADKSKPSLYVPMNHSAHGRSHPEHASHSEHEGHHAEPELKAETLTVDDLQASNPTTLPEKAKVMELKLELGGDMERYVWHINGKAIHEDRDINVNEGDVVRFTLQNNTMMHHPMHLHGHFFRVINKYGERSPLKHTVDVPPHGSRTIEFYANEPGQWMLHCHNLYHMKTGMARVVNYMSYKPKPEISAHAKHDPHLHEHIYTYGSLEASTNHAKGNFKLMRTWDELNLKLESRSETHKNFAIEGKWDLECDLLYKRWRGNFLNFIAGGSQYHDHTYGVAGFGYILPMLVETKFLVNHEGKFRFDLDKRFQWTKNLFTDAEFTWRPGWKGRHEGEFEISLMYGPSWSWSAGLMLTNDSLGAGAQIQF